MDATNKLYGDMCSVRGKKDINEDYALLSPPFGACLADGMGGEQMGSTVARCACKVASKALLNGKSAYDSLAEAQSYSKELVDNLDCGRCGAAITIVRCDGSDAQIAWAGDVLCLHFSGRSGNLTTLTRPERGSRGLTNAVGGEICTLNSAHCSVEPGDKIVLCTDGIWDDVDDDAIKQALLDAETPREAAVMLAMRRRHTDDATAVVLFVDK